MDKLRPVLAWLKDQATLVASLITITGFGGTWITGKLGMAFFVVFIAGLVFLVGSGFWRWYGPRRPAERFRAMHDEIAACREVQVDVELDRGVSSLMDADAAFMRLRMRLLTVQVSFPDTNDLARRRRHLDILAGLAVDGQVYNARLVGRDLRGVPRQSS